ncbi:MAG: ABC transporter permease, partial [Flavobacteriaceae bacterium]
VLGIRPIAVIVQLVRSGLIDVMGQEYIKTAYAKGLNSFQIVYKHAIKNTLNPVITAISGWFASMLAGAVFVEYIFGWRGLGKEIVNALNTLDIPVVMGAVLVIATLFTLLNIVVDYLYHYIDPKTNPF